MKNFNFLRSNVSRMDREWIGNESGLTRTSRGKVWRLTAMITLLLTLACGEMWGASVAEGTYNFVDQTIGAAKRFYKIDNGIYQYRLNAYTKNSSLGIQLPSSGDGTGFAFHLESTQKVYIGLCKKSVKREVTDNLYIKTITKANFDAIEAGSNNSTTVTLTLGGSATLSANYTFAAISSAKTEGATVYMGELPAGYYYAYGNSSNGEGNLYSISFGTQTLFLVPNDKTASDAKFAIYYWMGATGYERSAWTDYMTVSPCNSSTYSADIPKGYTNLIFVRLNPSGGINWDSKWNQTGNLTFDGSKDLFTWANGSWDGATTTWSASTKYTISFAANGGSGSMSNVSGIACGRSVTLAANAYTKSGYSFTGWKTNVAVTANGSPVAADGIVDDEATISNITSNITLTAQWESDAPAGCTAPSALAKSSVTAKGATLTVTDAVEDGDDYEFYVSTSSTAPTAESTATHTAVGSKSITITSCVANTTYYAWARTKCSASNKSDWVALTGSTFTTSTVSVTHTLTNVTKTSGGATAGGSTYTAVFAAASGYSMPTPTVTIDGNTATSGTDYTWSSGTLTIPANKINGNIVVTLNSAPAAPTNVDISGTYWYYPGETISLTATATGGNGPKTYQWYKGGTAEGNKIAGATSATYSKATCVVGDAGSYYCKVTCGGSASRTSSAYQVKIMQFYLKNSGGSDISNHALTKVDATHATLGLSLTGGTTYKFRVTDGCGNWYGNSDETGMTSSNCTNWTMPHDADCKMTTNGKSATYTFNFDFTDGLLGSEMKVSIVYPEGNQASGKVIYWDNSVLNWASAPWYRIGKSTHNNKTQMTLVSGTANLYKVTTTAYDGFEYWHIANNEGEGTGNIFWTKDSDPTTNEEITNAMGFEGSPVTADAVTFTPTSSHATGTSSDNDNCEFYEYGQQNGMKRDRVTITAPVNGTITVNYTSEEGVASSFSAITVDMNQDLAHTVILTSITAVSNTGYDAGAITINGGAYSANYVVTGATTIAASFTLHNYNVTYNTPSNGNYTIKVASGSASSASKTATMGQTITLAATPSTGYHFTGWTITNTDNSTDITNSVSLSGQTENATFTMPAANISIVATFAINTYTVSFAASPAGYGSVSPTSIVSVNHGSTVSIASNVLTLKATNVTATPTSAGADYTYSFSGWSVSNGASITEAQTITANFTRTANQYSVTHTLTGVTTSSGATGANAATYGTNYTAVFAASSGYALPNSVTVTAGGSDITANCTYTKGTGTVSIPGSYITGNIVITVTGVEEVVCPSSASGETVYKFVTKSSDLGTGNVCATASTEYPQTTSNSLSTLTGGTLKAYGTGSLGQLTFSNDCYKLSGSDNTWLIVELDCAIATGDVIRYVNYASSGNTVMIETTRGTSTSIVMDGNGTMMEQTIVAPAALNGVKTLYLTRKAGTAFLTSFEILRPYTVTLDANTNGGKVGGNNTATMYFKDSESQALPHAFKSSNYFTGWFEDDDSGDAVDNPYTATGTGTLYAQFDACASQTGSLYKFAVKNTLTAGSPFTTGNDGNASMTVGNYLSSLYGGTLDIHGRKTYLTNTTSAFTLANNAAYLLVTLDCPLQAGDQIKSIVSSSSVAITTSSSRSTTNTLATGTNTITIPDGFAGKTTLYIWKNSSNGDISYLEIIRPNGVTITGAVSPDGYGTVSPASIFVASGSTVSLASNVLTCDGKTLTATPTAATAEYTYAFSSWSGVINGGTVSVATTATANFTRTANNHTLTWNTNGGSDLECDGCTSGSTAYGASITAPTDPTLSNYTFDGWKTNNDGTGTTAGSTMPAANTTYYAAWKQTVTLNTGSQGEGGNQTPYVYLNGTGVSSFTAHTASGYTLQGYYTAGSGGTKVLNADGTFASANVDGYITSSKWSRTGAAPTLYAQWLASEDCSTSDFVIKKGSSTEFEGCMESSSYNGTATSFTAGSPTTVGNAKMTISSYSKGAITRPGSGNVFSIVIEPVSGYYLKSICWAGKVEDDETVSYYWDNNSGSATTITPQTTSGTGVTYDAPNSTTTKFTASYTDDGDGSGGIWWRNVQVEVCAGGGTTYNVTYNGNDETGGTAPTDATNYSYGGTVTVKGNTGSLAKTYYSFVGWSTNDDGTGSNYVADNTFSITANTTLYAKWAQAVTFDANTSNHGSTGGSATAVWNAAGLTGITHATPASGYKLLGYYTTASGDGTKVLNSDGSFADDDVTNYITDGKWSGTGAAPTLYARYESAGSLIWNLGVNTSASSLTTDSKSSAFTEISTANMSNATVNGLTYTGSQKASLTGKISTPAYDAGKYVYVTFQIASGYKFTPSSIKVPVQPVGNGEHKAVELRLTDDASHSLVSASATECDGTSSGKTTTVTLAGDGTFFTGTVTMKIYVYPHASASASSNNCYRLGTPITIDGDVEATCATMPSYTSMSYTTTSFLPDADASGSPITIVGGDNIDTYQWKYNTVNDRTSGTNCGTNSASLTPLTNAGAATDVTRYYWCEMTNDDCGITIKSPAVAITVSAEKSDATVTWSNSGTVNYGGGGYTIRATVDQSVWNGDASDLIISAPAGIRIYNVTSGTDGSSRKYVEVNFDVQTSFDRATYTSTIPFTVSADATATYNAISDDNNVSYSACAGAGEGSSYNIRMRKTVTKDGNYYHCANTDGWISPNISSSYSTAKAGTTMATYFDTVASSNTQYVWVRTYHANIKKVRIYADFRANGMTVSNVYKHTAYFTANSKYEVDYSVIYNGDEENTDLGDAAQGYVDITLSDVMMSANDILLVSFSTNRVRPLGAVITESSSGSLATALSFASATVNKSQGDASFIQTATRDAAATTSLGAITYSSNNTSVATVNATTGEVTILGAGAATIKATLAASGCYQKAEATYTVNVAAVACTDVAGIVTTEDLGCGIRLTLSGYTEGATIAWYKDGAAITPAETGTTYTATSAGSYYAVTHNDCDKASNTVVLADKVVSAERIVEQWYIKNGRVTPDIALWSVGEGTSLSNVTWSPANATGLTAADFYLQDGVIYLKGKSPSSNDSGADIEYTLTLTVTNGCSPTEMSDASKQVTLIHQKNTDKHVLAFVVTGTEKGGFTAGITADQTTSVELYNTIAANFDVMATNIYSTDDEKKLKEYYSQFDILCVTDYPNTGTKGVNKKSYVDALGSLIDIRPILTMEAFVSKLDNWKVKGISGTPKSPTTRQYSMLLQCKDHEIFAGTELTKVGEGEDEMYRVNMVDNTLEDYATLDATYGGGEHAEKSGYNYGGKPALQGFTFDATMADDGLLPLGTIDDGAGNDLEVGLERQTEMSARLMVLGINSYAMERLTDDGQTVVINALKYLLKKNEEEIADCSVSFVGGAEGNETDWNTEANWKGGMMPDKTAREIRILAPVVITTGQMIHAQAPIKIAAEGRYNAGADIATGKITIAEGGALIVDGKIQAVTAPSYSKARATDADDIYIKASNTAQGALIFDNEDGDTHAVVEMWNPSYWEVEGGKKKKYWSYVAVPIQEADIPNFFWYGFTYLYDETSGWIKKGDGTSLYPFQGIGASLQTGNMETFYGPLATTESQDITLTYTAGVGQGMNLIGNSWTAPIQIANFEADDFGEATATVWVFNTGHENGGSPGSGTTTTAGQWNAIPINAPSVPGYEGLKVIPAMQAFEVNTSSETTLHLDYDRLVRSGRTNLNEPMRAPRRSAAKQLEATMRVRVSGELTHTDVYLLKDARFSDAFDNGWDGHYLSGDDRSAKLYAVSEEEGALAFLAQPEIDGTALGFAPSRYGNDYTFTFYYLGEEEYYLNDIKLQQSTLISEEESYFFTFEEGDTNRFYISKTPFNAPSVATGTENTGDGLQKARKILYNNHVYIIRAGKVYGIDGTLVAPNMEQK